MECCGTCGNNCYDGGEFVCSCEASDSHFTIKMSDREDECGTDTDFMVARNEHDEYMTGRIVGVDECWQDGDLNTCVAGLLRGIATIAHSRY